MKMPLLTGERVFIRPFTRDDLPTLTSIYHAEGYDTQGLTDTLQWRNLNDAQLAQLWQPPYGERAVCLQSTGELIGAVGLVPSWGPFQQLPSLGGIEGAKYQPELGLYWMIASSQRGNGYATEAGQLLITFAFSVLKAIRIIATTEHDNHASQQVMRKLGMTLETNPYPEPNWLQVVGILYNKI